MIRDHRLMGVKEGLWGVKPQNFINWSARLDNGLKKALAAESDAQF